MWHRTTPVGCMTARCLLHLCYTAHAGCGCFPCFDGCSAAPCSQPPHANVDNSTAGAAYPYDRRRVCALKAVWSRVNVSVLPRRLTCLSIAHRTRPEVMWVVRHRGGLYHSEHQNLDLAIHFRTIPDRWHLRIPPHVPVVTYELDRPQLMTRRMARAQNADAIRPLATFGKASRGRCEHTAHRQMHMRPYSLKLH